MFDEDSYLVLGFDITGISLSMKDILYSFKSPEECSIHIQEEVKDFEEEGLTELEAFEDLFYETLWENGYHYSEKIDGTVYIGMDLQLSLKEEKTLDFQKINELASCIRSRFGIPEDTSWEIYITKS